MSAFDTQTEGNYYTQMRWQWFNFAMQAGWDTGASAVLKYVCRHGQKDGFEGGKKDIEKAVHYVYLRKETLYLQPHAMLNRNVQGVSGFWSLLGRRIPRTAEFCAANGLRPEEVSVLRALEDWIAHPFKPGADAIVIEQLQAILRRDYEDPTDDLFDVVKP